MAQPICVVSGDIHYNLNNLEAADKSTRMAIAKANELKVPFLANGDTQDQKANLRAECVNAMIETFKTAEITPYINIGNHCKIHAKSKEHALNFLRPYATVVDEPMYCPLLRGHVIPYHDDVEELRTFLKHLPENSLVYLHQGLNGSDMGEYITDHSALNPDDLRNFRSILSHYHARQDIKCGRPRKHAVGLASYVGSPYSASFGEANDPEKGFQILMDDGTLEFVPTNLRRHVVMNYTYARHEDGSETMFTDHCKRLNGDELIWVKINGTKEMLAKVTKEGMAKLIGRSEFRLDLIPTDNDTRYSNKTEGMRQSEILDDCIDNKNSLSHEKKQELKKLWKNL